MGNRDFRAGFKALRVVAAPEVPLAPLPDPPSRHYAAPLDAAASVRAAPHPMRLLAAVRRARWNRASPLAREVALVLVVKAGALVLLWWLCFSAPLAPRMSVAPEHVAARLLAPIPPFRGPDARP